MCQGKNPQLILAMATINVESSWKKNSKVFQQAWAKALMNDGTQKIEKIPRIMNEWSHEISSQEFYIDELILAMML